MDALKEKQLQFSSLVENLLNQNGLTPVKVAHQDLLLELIHVYSFSIEQISKETSVKENCLSSLAAGTLDRITFSEYSRLLCFYCFMQTKRESAATNHERSLVMIQRWQDAVGSVPLGIYTKDKKITNHKKRFFHRYYVCKKEGVYLTEQEHTLAYYFLNTDKTYKTIANDLSLSPRTVEYYVQNLKIKLGAKNKEVLKKKLRTIRHLIRI